jgi:hypothetical protein
MSKTETLEFSSITRTDVIAGESVSILIYRIVGSGWRLRATNTRGTSAVWKKHFETEQAALDAYLSTLQEDGPSFIKRAASMLEVMEGFNPLLLQPRDKRFSDPKRYSQSYTLRVFRMVKKYSGLWPVQNLLGHFVSGYLYSGVPPDWPHPCKGMPGAPENIHVEFTISPDHIEDAVIHDMGLRPVITNYFSI